MTGGGVVKGGFDHGADPSGAAVVVVVKIVITPGAVVGAAVVGGAGEGPQAISRTAATSGKRPLRAMCALYRPKLAG
jgi:hypothetical protein